jgi:formiminoglutamate deiminase
MSYWCSTVLIDGVAEPSVRIEFGSDGRITAIQRAAAPADEDVRLGTVVPGMGNAHSHAFHRVLRGRTHSDGGDFWRWRESMYRAASVLDPTRYLALARAVFAEMLVSGWTAVGEFHYVHHQPDGTPWAEPHAMELAISRAAAEVGIRLVLLDTLYLAGGIGQQLAPDQRAFGDGTTAAWLDRWHSLRETIGDRTTLGAAIHSVRAVPPEDIRLAVLGLPDDVPLHVHVSEQPRENRDSLAAYGRTPVGVLADAGALSPRTSLVHATHLTAEDRAIVAESGATVVFCPTTEADLGDGIGPARALADAGTPIALGSDQNAVIDPFLEMRGLEAGERLASGSRGRFDPARLLAAASTTGYASLGLGDHRLAVGDPCDLVEVAATSLRTVGSRPAQLPMTATASDVERVIVGGRLAADRGRLVPAEGIAFGRRPENLLLAALTELFSPEGGSVDDR